MNHQPDLSATEKTVLRKPPVKDMHSGWNESNYTDSRNETKWKGYHNDSDLGHAAGDYEPITHKGMSHATDYRKPNASVFREKDAHADELIDESLHLLMEDDLRAYEVDQIRAEFGDMQGPSLR